MTQTEFERALAMALKSLFDEATCGLEQLRKIVLSKNHQMEDMLCFSNTYEIMLSIRSKLEALRFFADAMIEDED